MIVGDWVCGDGTRATFAADGWLRVVNDGAVRGGRWTNQDWNLFLDLNPDEDWRLVTRNGEPVLIRNYVSSDLGGDADCERSPQHSDQ